MDLTKFTNPSPSSKRKTTRKATKSKRDGYVISLCGVHGIGKTTVYNLLTTMFSEYNNIQFFPERLLANPPWPFGSKDKNIAFRSELHYNQQMLKRDLMVKKFVANKRESIAILDRSPICTLIYSRALDLPEKDYQLIEDTYHSVSWIDEHVIYLDASPETVMERIVKRGSLDTERLKWNEDDLNYLKRIQFEYNRYIRETNLETKNHLDRINTDYLTPQQVAEQIIKIIEKKSGILLKKPIKLPVNQSLLSDWF